MSFEFSEEQVIATNQALRYRPDREILREYIKYHESGWQFEELAMTTLGFDRAYEVLSSCLSQVPDEALNSLSEFRKAMTPLIEIALDSVAPPLVDYRGEPVYTKEHGPLHFGLLMITDSIWIASMNDALEAALPPKIFSEILTRIRSGNTQARDGIADLGFRKRFP